MVHLKNIENPVDIILKIKIKKKDLCKRNVKQNMIIIIKIDHRP